MTKAIVLGGSKGIGKAIAQALQSIGIDTVATSRRDIDTSDIASVKNFLETHRQTDILVLNTGGPLPIQFPDITEEDWNMYHNQLFLGFCIILQNIKINDGGYIFLISSSVMNSYESQSISRGT